MDALLGRITLPVPNKSIDGMVVTGNEIEIIAKLCEVPLENDTYSIKTETIMALFKTIRMMTPEKISFRYGLSEEQAEMLYSALAIYVRLSKMTQAKYILSPKVELWSPLMHHMLIRNLRKNIWTMWKATPLLAPKPLQSAITATSSMPIKLLSMPAKSLTESNEFTA